MQPIIDAIKELIHGQLGYFDRGDPGAFDFNKPDLITDNTWRDLDLSAIVPADAQGVVLHVKFRSPNIGAPVRFRKKSNVNLFNTSISGTAVANVNHWADLTCPIDANRFLQYQIANVVWNIIEITISAWWLR